MKKQIWSISFIPSFLNLLKKAITVSYFSDHVNISTYDAKCSLTIYIYMIVKTFFLLRP